MRGGRLGRRARIIILLTMVILPAQAFAFWWLVPQALRASLLRFAPSSAVVKYAGKDAADILVSRVPWMRLETDPWPGPVKAQIHLGKAFLSAASVFATGLTIAELLGYSSATVNQATPVCRDVSGNYVARADLETNIYPGSKWGISQSWHWSSNLTCNANSQCYAISVPDTYYSPSRVTWDCNAGTQVIPFTLNPADNLLNDLYSAPTQAEKDAKAAEIVKKLQQLDASELLPPDLITYPDAGQYKGIRVGPDGKTHLYTTDANGQMYVDGIPVDNPQDYSQSASYTDANGVKHTLVFDENGNLLDNGQVVEATVNQSVSTTTASDGTQTVTTSTQGAGGSVVETTQVLDSYGNVISQNQTATTQNNDPSQSRSAWANFGDNLATGLGSSLSTMTAGGLEECFSSKYAGTHCLSEFDHGWTGYVQSFMSFVGWLIALLMPVYAGIRF